MVDTPHSEHFDDIYFAVEDGLAESRYVFLEQNQLPSSWQGKEEFVICETGFGTGLNFLCAWTEFEKSTHPNQQLHYYSFEKFPLSALEIQKYLAHWSHEFDGRLEKLVAVYPMRVGGWHTIRVSAQVTLTLILDDVNRALPELNMPIDCWFLDGHAPAKNPDMWSETVFKSMGRLSRKGAHLASFTAAGFVRRGLAENGFTVSKARGFGRKRDMTVGVFDKDNHPISHTTSPKKIAIIGGGIAGAALAYSLHSRGLDVTLYEKKGLASGGSGNFRGLCNPRVTATRGLEADFYSPAFAKAHHLFADISKHHDIGFNPCGSLHLITDETKEKRFTGFINQWGWHTDHARYLTAAEASNIAGISLSCPALFLENSAMVSPQLTTEFLAKPARIITSKVSALNQTPSGWSIDAENYDVVILCNGHDVLKFPEAAFLPLQKVRGQVTRIRTTPLYAQLKTNLCYGGYAGVAVGDQAVVGSTFQHWIESDALRPEDDNDNLGKLKSVAPELVDGLEVIGARAGFRCAAKDRTPVIGKLGDNLYISTAHGSHGILSSVMGAEYLASLICSEPQILPKSVGIHLSPDRFRN